MGSSKKESQERELYKALLKLNSVEECHAFFHDLCTPAEIHAMAERWQIAELLFSEDFSYRELHERTGSSLTTIGRVARFLKEEHYQGYMMILKRLKE